MPLKMNTLHSSISPLIPSNKVELHRHIDCSMRFNTMIKIAKELKIQMPSSEKLQKEHFLITEPMNNLKSVLDKFKRAQTLLYNTAVLKNLAYDTVCEAANEGVKVLELRYSPQFIQEGHSHFTLDNIHESLLNGIQMAQKEHTISVGLILIILRTQSPHQSNNLVDFAINNKSTIVGIDLAESENDGYDVSEFANSFQKAKRNGLHITVHAGEIPTEKSKQNIITSILDLGADRIGHGIQAIHSAEALKLLIEKKIPLEICLTSNYLTQGVDQIENHPLRKLYNEGVLLTLNTDDPGLFDLTLTSELYLAHKKLFFNLQELTEFQKIAFKYSFIPTHEKEKFSHYY